MTGNQDQIDYWNGQAGETWVQAQARLDSMLASLSDHALAKANPQPGERVIDVGCGCGTTSIAMAEQGAAVWGIDISAPMLALAKSRAEHLDNIAFAQCDASQQPLTVDHDLIFSRFGVMFFDDPVAAFTNLRSGLKPGGRMVFLCWQAPAKNPWVSVGGRAIQQFLPEDEPIDPKAPGPFAFADPDYLRGILERAGFSRIDIQNLNMDLIVGETLDAAMEFQGEVGPMARVLAELSGEVREQAIQAARAALEPFVTDAGVKLGSATWLVSATNGEG
jgi:SAM-dependent methyltransferase